MKCALIIPSWVPEDLFPTKTANSQVNYWQPLGTLYVASALIQAGHKVQLFNGAFLSHQQILEEVKDFAPGFVGIYSTTFGWPRAIQTSKDICALNINTFICVGGPYPTAVQEECLRSSEGYIDAVVYGEAEETLTELVFSLEQGHSLHKIQGVIFKKDHEIIKNEPRALIEDLDSLPFPARDLLGEEVEKYVPPPATYKRKPVAVIITSRGCNRRCIYCSQFDKDRKSGIRGVRYRSIESVIEEIEYCLNRGYKEIKFIDDTFASDYDRAMQLCNAIKARGLNFTWFASACANQVDKPLLKAMKDAGCWALLIGAESGVQKNLNTLRKGIKLEHVRRAVKAAKETGIRVSTPFIIGIPGETYQDALQTIDFAVELNPDFANFHALTPFPGTPLYNNIEKYGSISENLEEYTYQGAAFVPYTMSRRQIQELRQMAFRRFYGRPSFLIKKAFQIRNINDLKAALKGVKSLFWIYAKKGLFNKKRNPSVVKVS